MSQYLIKLADGEPMPHYLATQSHGAAFAWTPMLGDSRKFETEDDADNFVEKRMPHMEVQVVKAP